MGSLPYKERTIDHKLVNHCRKKKGYLLKYSIVIGTTNSKDLSTLILS